MSRYTKGAIIERMAPMTTKSSTFVFILCISFATSVYAEKWSHAGLLTITELGRTYTLDVYGDSDSASRNGDLATMNVRGFMSDPNKSQNVSFECVQESMILTGKRLPIKEDGREQGAFLPSDVIARLHKMACGKWYEFWK